MQTADQREADREAKLLQKAALYERLQSGQDCTSSGASDTDFLVDFERLAQQQLSHATQADQSGRPLPSYNPVEFRQQGLLQVKYYNSMPGPPGFFLHVFMQSRRDEHGNVRSCGVSTPAEVMNSGIGMVCMHFLQEMKTNDSAYRNHHI